MNIQILNKNFEGEGVRVSRATIIMISFWLKNSSDGLDGVLPNTMISSQNWFIYCIIRKRNKTVNEQSDLESVTSVLFWCRSHMLCLRERKCFFLNYYENCLKTEPLRVMLLLTESNSWNWRKNKSSDRIY